jgi:hypothetical protein
LLPVSLRIVDTTVMAFRRARRRVIATENRPAGVDSKPRGSIH